MHAILLLKRVEDLLLLSFVALEHERDELLLLGGHDIVEAVEDGRRRHQGRLGSPWCEEVGALRRVRVLLAKQNARRLRFLRLWMGACRAQPSTDADVHGHSLQILIRRILAGGVGGACRLLRGVRRAFSGVDPLELEGLHAAGTIRHLPGTQAGAAGAQQRRHGRAGGEGGRAGEA
eukprot:scaffold149_cov315-Pinguiococcus_pyrenoidosus.AAC.27